MSAEPQPVIARLSLGAARAFHVIQVRPPGLVHAEALTELAQCVHFGFRIGEVSCPTRYFAEASSINFRRSLQYGLGVLLTTLQFVLHRWGVARFRIFSPQGRRLETSAYYASGSEVAPGRPS